MRDLCRKKWRNHKWAAGQRGLGHLTYEQYVAKLAEAGITAEQVSRKKGGYCLARYTDKGDYTPESCRFAPLLVNAEDRKKNGGHEAMLQKKIGRTKLTHEGIARQAEKMRGRTAKTHPNIAVRSAKAGNTMRGRTKYTHASHAITAEKTSCDYAFLDPSGKLHTGRGLNDFAKANGLLANAMSKLRHGRLKTYKGWTLAERTEPCESGPFRKTENSAQ